MLTDEKIVEILDLTTYVHPITKCRCGFDTHSHGLTEDLVAKVREVEEREKPK